ncbi:MAG: hypothetical protein H0T57_15225 [Rubrobacter sp.]|nr:hypothetical protein [Rubrobacter sp.]
MADRHGHEEVGIEFKGLVEQEDEQSASFTIHYRDGTTIVALVSLGEIAW